MGMIKGQSQYQQFKAGKKLSRAKAQLAMCYQCNGFEESNVDCGCKNSCSMYDYSPYKGVKTVENYGKNY